MVKEPFESKYICLITRIDQKCCCTRIATKSEKRPLIDRWPIVFENLINLPRRLPFDRITPTKCAMLNSTIVFTCDFLNNNCFVN